MTTENTNSQFYTEKFINYLRPKHEASTFYKTVAVIIAVVLFPITAICLICLVTAFVVAIFLDILYILCTCCCCKEKPSPKIIFEEDNKEVSDLVNEEVVDLVNEEVIDLDNEEVVDLVNEEVIDLDNEEVIDLDNEEVIDLVNEEDFVSKNEGTIENSSSNNSNVFDAEIINLHEEQVPNNNENLPEKNDVTASENKPDLLINNNNNSNSCSSENIIDNSFNSKNIFDSLVQLIGKKEKNENKQFFNLINECEDKDNFKNEKTKENQTLLHLAVMFDDKEKVDFLIDKKLFDPNATDQVKNTPLHRAILNASSKSLNSFFILQKLVKNSTPETFHMKNKEEQTPIDLACHLDNPDIISIINNNSGITSININNSKLTKNQASVLLDKLLKND